MIMEKLTEFDMAEYLDTEELQQGYLDYNAQEGTPEDMLRAINTVARARHDKNSKRSGNHKGRTLQSAFSRRQSCLYYCL